MLVFWRLPSQQSRLRKATVCPSQPTSRRSEMADSARVTCEVADDLPCLAAWITLICRGSPGGALPAC